MALNRDFVGHTFPPTEPYEVSRVKIAEFATAIGDSNPLYHDKEAAKAAGYPDVVVPPTFPVVVSMRATGRAVTDERLGLNYAMVVHGEQRFAYVRPLHAGDVVTARTTISDIRSVGRNAVLSTKTEVTTVEGELVCTAYATLVERGGG